MALHWFRKKENKNPAEQPEIAAPEDPVTETEVPIPDMAGETLATEKEKVDLRDDAARISYLQRLYESIQEAKRQCGDIKSEYGQVTSYLKDRPGAPGRKDRTLCGGAPHCGIDKRTSASAEAAV